MKCMQKLVKCLCHAMATVGCSSRRSGNFLKKWFRRKKEEKKQRHGINKMDFGVVRRKKDLYN